MQRPAEVRVSIAQRAATQSALLASVLVAVLTLVAFLVAQSSLVDGSEGAFGTARTVAAAMLAAGGGLIILSALFARMLAQRLTKPLIRLASTVAGIHPGHWQYRRSVYTGDEIEVLDTAAADMSNRLERMYEHLEEEVQARTEELKVQYERDRTILQSIEHSILVVDAEGNVTDANAASEELLSADADTLKRTDIAAILRLCLHGAPIERLQHPVHVCLQQRVPIRPQPNVRWSIEQTGGNHIPIMLTVTPILRRRQLVGAIAVFHDVTEERKVDYLKSEFISLASHQLRTPLSTIQWYVELFASEGEDPLSVSQKEYLREMGHAARRMVNLVDALLRSARLEGGAITPATKYVEMFTFFTDLAEELRSLAKTKRITCVTQAPRAPATMRTDPVLLHVVFQNLFSNAVKYTPKSGSVELSMRVTKTVIEVHVSDTGIGIPRREQKRIFEKLFRAENARKIDTDGNGLGLYISKMILESLGGSITFQSTEGKGTSFKVRLPRRQSRR